MARKLTQRDLETQINKIHNSYPNDGEGWEYSRKEVRDNYAFQIGDVVSIRYWPEHRPEPEHRRALVIGRFCREDSNGDGYIAQYRVRYLTRDEIWSKTWIYVYPADIERGFELQEK